MSQWRKTVGYGFFNLLLGLTTLPDGTIYAADFSTYALAELSSNGTLIRPTLAVAGNGKPPQGWGAGVGRCSKGVQPCVWKPG